MGKSFALICAVGDYSEMGLTNLVTWEVDQDIIYKTITENLHFDSDSVKCLGQNGAVSTQNFAHCIKMYANSLTENDLLLMYFSGHGDGNGLIFSNSSISIQSILCYIDNLNCKSKIVILDCCSSGNFERPKTRKLNFEDSINSFTGKGIAILASSAKDEASRLGEGGKYSLYTAAVAAALSSKRKAKKGVISLNDINEEVIELMNFWNHRHPDKQQHPVFRSSIGGTVYFQVNDSQAYEPKQIYVETPEYSIYSVKSLSTGNLKRLCAFVVAPKNRADEKRLAYWTKEIVERIKDADVYSSERSEKRFGKTTARAIWCYFGHDESDITRHLHYAYTIWADSEDLVQRYYREKRSSRVVEGIYEWNNPDYERLKSIQMVSSDKEDYFDTVKVLLAEIVNYAEEFIAALQEVKNRTCNIEDIRERHYSWIRDVYRSYMKLSNLPEAPLQLYAWSQKVMELAGNVVDMALLLQATSENSYAVREKWLIDRAVRMYYSELESLSETN